MKYFIVLFSFFFAPLIASAQPDTLWTRVWGGAGDYTPTCIREYPANGGYAVTGYGHVTNGSYDMYVAKLTTEGDVLWERSYDLGSDEFAYGVDVVSDSELFVAGQRGGALDYRSAILLRLDAIGDTIFSQAYGGWLTAKYFVSVATTQDGGCLAFGASWWSGDYGWYVMKLTASGDSVWAMRGPGSGGNYGVRTLFSDATRSSDFGIVAVSGLHGAGYDPMGHPEHWSDLTVRTYGTSGDSLWQSPGPSGWSTIDKNRITWRGDGSVLCLSHPADSSSVVVEYSGEGVRGNTYPLSYLATDIASGVDNGFVVVSSPDGQSIWLEGFDSTGHLVFHAAYAGFEEQHAATVDFTSDSCYLITSSARQPSGALDIRVIKTQPVLALVTGDLFIPHPSSFILSSYPNPFNPSTTISFSLPKPGEVSLKVYDVTGRWVETLAERRYEAGEHKVTFDGAGLPSGIYFARLEAGQIVKSTKLLLLK